MIFHEKMTDQQQYHESIQILLASHDEFLFLPCLPGYSSVGHMTQKNLGETWWLTVQDAYAAWAARGFQGIRDWAIEETAFRNKSDVDNIRYDGKLANDIKFNSLDIRVKNECQRDAIKDTQFISAATITSIPKHPALDLPYRKPMTGVNLLLYHEYFLHNIRLFAYVVSFFYHRFCVIFLKPLELTSRMLLL